LVTGKPDGKVAEAAGEPRRRGKPEKKMHLARRALACRRFVGLPAFGSLAVRLACREAACLHRLPVDIATTAGNMRAPGSNSPDIFLEFRMFAPQRLEIKINEAY
jgi:hypothetical protein